MHIHCTRTINSILATPFTTCPHSSSSRKLQARNPRVWPCSVALKNTDATSMALRSYLDDSAESSLFSSSYDTQYRRCTYFTGKAVAKAQYMPQPVSRHDEHFQSWRNTGLIHHIAEILIIKLLTISYYACIVWGVHIYRGNISSSLQIATHY
jgi:hypothetical protein